ncbi:MAG TPA: hypothetical protein VL651_00825 [Bacteroidia bacterium]|jgi:hypothetical protein|nr:hypothetical protein [Bacteroidia bacterium]
MKKYFFLLILVPYLFIAGTGQAKRFPTADDMSKALLAAMQANDSVRYVELCATKSEAVTALVTPYKDSATVQAAKQRAIDGYYASPNIAYTTFRMERNKVVAEKLDWKQCVFVSATSEQTKDRSKGIDYIYSVRSLWKIGDREIGVTLGDVLKTAEGWNCGMQLKISVPPAGQHVSTGMPKGKADSTHRADSMMHVHMAMKNASIAKRKADSTHMADSIAKAHPKPH